MHEFDPLDGALLIDKPAGPTSHDVVDVIRRQFGIKKAGHCGTLDPNASGLLVLVLGRATKLSEKLMSVDKIYAGTIKFGETTDSYDAQGKIIAERPVPAMTVEEINQMAGTFVGDLMQVPPMVSAIKQGGIPLYKLARKGIEVERKARLIHIYQFLFESYNAPLGVFRVMCTKGTYVRTLAHDLGEKLGCGGHLATLRRLASGNFKIENAIPFEHAAEISLEELKKHIVPFLALAQETSSTVSNA